MVLFQAFTKQIIQITTLKNVNVKLNTLILDHGSTINYTT